MDSNGSDRVFLRLVQPRVFAPNRRLNLYVLSRELVGIWTDGAGDFEQDRDLETKTLGRLRSNPKAGIMPSVDDVRSARLFRAGWWRQMLNPIAGQAGVLQLKMVGGKKWTFAFCTAYDVWAGIQSLRAVLGSKL